MSAIASGATASSGSHQQGGTMQVTSPAEDALEQLRQAKEQMSSLGKFKLNTAQEKLIKYSKFGDMLEKFAEAGVGLVPVAGPFLAALLGSLQIVATTVLVNKGACMALFNQINQYDAALASVAAKVQELPAAVVDGLTGLAKVLTVAAGFVVKYIDQGPIKCVAWFSSNQASFQELQEQLKQTMLTTYMVWTGELLLTTYTAAKSPTFSNAVLKAAVDHGLLCTKADDAIRQLSESGSGRDALKAVMDKVSASTDAQLYVDLITQIDRLKDEIISASPDALVPYLADWWAKSFGAGDQSVNWASFKSKVKDSLNLSKYQRLTLALGLEVASAPCAVDVDLETVLLDKMLLKALDADGDGNISTQELLKLQQRCASAVNGQRWNWDEYLRNVFNQFKGKELQGLFPPSDDLTYTHNTLNVQEIIKSYNTLELFDEYKKNTRVWMFEKAQAWKLKAVAARKNDASCLFLLLAGPGMGKSVFSAVQLAQWAAEPSHVVAYHFFKAGQDSGEGKAMIKSLMQQLCARIPDLAGFVAKALKDIQDMKALSLKELFEQVMLRPLQDLTKAYQHNEHPVCMLLIDALDESQDGQLAKNSPRWHAVCGLLATQFKQLPPWVCVVVTGRPEDGLQETFVGWTLETIEDTDVANQKDLCMVIEAQLKEHGLVEQSNLDAATDILLTKSQGRFLYIKYILRHLRSRTATQTSWSIEQLQKLPRGFDQLYAQHLDTTKAILTQASSPGPKKLQPVLSALAVVKAPVSTPFLSWLVQDEEQGESLQDSQKKVLQVMQHLHGLFPGKRDRSSGDIVYTAAHKSVQDFLLGDSSSTVQWRVDGASEHRSISKRLLSELTKVTMQHCRDKCAAQVLPDMQTAQQYCMKHLVDHLTAAEDWEQLHKLMRCLPGLKAVLETSGQVYNLIRALASTIPMVTDKQTRQDLQSAQQFLRGSEHLIQTHPHCLLQEMAFSPQGCVFGDWCEEDYHPSQVQSQPMAFWRGAVLVASRAQTSQLAHFRPSFTGHTSNITSGTISDDKCIVAAGAADGTVKVWDVETGKLRFTMKCCSVTSKDISSCTISPDGAFLVAATEDELQVWDLANGKTHKGLEPHDHKIDSCLFSPDGNILLTASTDGVVKGWDAKVWKKVFELQAPKRVIAGCLCFQPISEGMYHAAHIIQADNHTLLSGKKEARSTMELPMLVSAVSTGIDKGVVRVWNLFTQKFLTSWQTKLYEIRCCSYSAATDELVCGGLSMSSRAGIQVYDICTGDYKGEINSIGRVVGCAYVPSTEQLVSLTQYGRLEVWDMRTRTARFTFYLPAARAVALSSDGSIALSNGESDDWRSNPYRRAQKLKVHDLTSLQASLLTPQAHAGGSGWMGQLCGGGSICMTSPIMLGGRQIQLWSVSSGQLLYTHTRLVSEAQISPDGTVMVLLPDCRNGVFEVWKITAGTAVKGSTFYMRVDYACPVAISSDNATCIILHEKAIEAWDLSQNRRRWHKGHSQNIFDIGIHHTTSDSKCVVTTIQGRAVEVLDLETGSVQLSLQHRTARIAHLVQHQDKPDQRLLVIGTYLGLEAYCSQSTPVQWTSKWWSTGEEQQAIASDDKLLIAVSDKGLQAWDVQSMQLVSTLKLVFGKGGFRASACQFTPDGGVCVVYCGTNGLMVLKLPEVSSWLNVHLPEQSSFPLLYEHGVSFAYVA